MVEQIDDLDPIYEVFDLLEDLYDKFQKELQELIGEDNGKKTFIKALTRIFGLLLNTKVNSLEKTQGILKIAVKTVIKLLREPN